MNSRFASIIVPLQLLLICVVTFFKLSFETLVRAPVYNAYRLGYAGANSIAGALQQDLILQSALTAFQEVLLPLSLFSTAFYDIPLKGTDQVQVPYYPLDTSASQDFNGSYVFPNGTSIQAKALTINKRKYQSMSFTSQELRRQPQLDPVKYGALKGRKLAEDILQDIFSVVTNANFGAPIFTGAASTLDIDDVIDMGATLNAAKWPQTPRGMITGPTYIANMQKELISDGGAATFLISPTGTIKNFPDLFGFSFASTNIVPGNGENLIGMLTFPSCILVGFAPIEPSPIVAKELSRYDVVTDGETQLSLEYREWGNAQADSENRIIECNYGYAKGEAAALYRMVSA